MLNAKCLTPSLINWARFNEVGTIKKMRKFPPEQRANFKVFEQLTTPAKIQDFLDTLPINFERNGETCRSPFLALEAGEAHCMEGAMLAASALWFHGQRPWLLDLKTEAYDDSHVVAIFKDQNRWGAISKTNHVILRYRDPVYLSVRELAMSYFNEYFLDDGGKTLRSYSRSFDLLRYDDSWLTARHHLWDVVDAIDKSRHFSIINKKRAQVLRLADKIEIESGLLTEWGEN